MGRTQRKDKWVMSNYRHSTAFNPENYDWLTEPNYSELNKNIVSINSILPDDLIEKILVNLPIISIFRLSCVCKKWHEIVTSDLFLRSIASNVSSQMPWYYMFTSPANAECFGYSYDPTMKKWCSIDLPPFVTSNWFIAASFGLVCFMNKDSRGFIHVCNLITKSSKDLLVPEGIRISDYTALAISVNKTSHNYTISLVKSNQLPENFHEWEISIHLYTSQTNTWTTSSPFISNEWRAGEESIIIDNILYFLVYSTGSRITDDRHGLIKYNLSNHSSENSLMENFIPSPAILTSGRIMNVTGRLVLVGGIGKKDRADVITGIGIWVLNKTRWKEVAKMPNKVFQGFGEFDDVFVSSGANEIVYIHSYGSPNLLLFDMNSKEWRWAQKSPMSKRNGLQLFYGFCFEPKLEVSP